MEQRNNLQKQIKKYAQQIEHYENRINILLEYEEINLDRLQDKCDDYIENNARRLDRELLALEYYLSDGEEQYGKAVEEKLANRRAELRMQYRAMREDTRRQIELDKNKEQDLNDKLSAYELELNSQLEALATKLESEKPTFIAKFNAKANAKDYKSLVEAKRAYNKDSLENVYTKIAVQKLNKRKEAFIVANNKNIDKCKAKLKQAKANLAQLRQSSYEDKLANDVILSADNLCMYFGGLKAVDQLSFEVKKGEIFGLIGPNGAGKTTVFNCITQFYNPTAGDIYFRNNIGKVVRLNDEIVHDVITHGIARTFQNVEVIKEVSVLQNLLIAATRQYTSNLVEHALHLPILKVEEIVIIKRAEKVLEYMGLTPYKNMIAYGLPYGVLKKIEIARTLMTKPELIILDEPAAGLNDTETAELAKLIQGIGKNFGTSILLVEHDMGLVMDICHHICAISFGRLLAFGTPLEIQGNKKVQEAYLGTSED